MTYRKLRDSIANKLKLSHIYQSVMMIRLIKQDRTAKTKEAKEDEIIQAILEYSGRVSVYYRFINYSVQLPPQTTSEKSHELSK